MANRIRELLNECADVNRWDIEALHIHSDHVHIIVQLDPNVSINKMIQQFKNKSDQKIRLEFPELEEFAWGNNFWAEGFFAETDGIVDLTRIKAYVKEQWL